MDAPSGGTAIILENDLSLRFGRLASLRLRRARRALPASRGMLFDHLAEALRTLPPETRARILAGPDIRGFLTEVETWLAVRGLALGLLPGRRLSSGAGGGRQRRSWYRQARLFDHVSRTQYLTVLVPRGRIDPGFAARCLRFAHRRLDEAFFDLAAL